MSTDDVKLRQITCRQTVPAWNYHLFAEHREFRVKKNIEIQVTFHFGSTKKKPNGQENCTDKTNPGFLDLYLLGSENRWSIQSSPMH